MSASVRPACALLRRGSLAPAGASSEGWWEVLVTLQLVTSSFVLRHPIYSRATGSLPEISSGGGSCAHGGRAYEARLNLILPAVKWFAEPKPAGDTEARLRPRRTSARQPSLAPASRAKAGGAGG